MHLDIGKNIQKQRRDLHMTQDQLARALGVSVAAVSKWETGAAYPDITLLPPLARILEKSVDELLGYEANLTNRQILDIAGQCAGDLESLPYSDALARCEDRLKEYPNSLMLKLRMGHVYMMHLAAAGTPEAADELVARAVSLLEAAAASSEPTVRDAARHNLGAYYLAQERYEDSCRILQSIPGSSVDPERMLVSVYYAMGDLERAAQQAQYLLAHHFAACDIALVTLAKIARRKNDNPLAIRLLHLDLQLSHLLGRDLLYGQDHNQHLMLAEIHCERGDTAAALTALRDYLRCVQMPDTLEAIRGNPLFDRINLSEPQVSREYLMRCARQAVTENPAFESLRDNPVFVAILADINQLIVEASKNGQK